MRETLKTRAKAKGRALEKMASGPSAGEVADDEASEGEMTHAAPTPARQSPTADQMDMNIVLSEEMAQAAADRRGLEDDVGSVLAPARRPNVFKAPTAALPVHPPAALLYSWRLQRAKPHPIFPLRIDMSLSTALPFNPPT